jgi:hypothetical protein
MITEVRTFNHRYYWLRGVTRFEVYNEPDLVTSLSTDQQLWLDQYRIRSKALQDVYEDLNNGAATPLQCMIGVGAFAKTTYDPFSLGNMGGETVRARGLAANGLALPSSGTHMQAYSYHSYGEQSVGKTGVRGESSQVTYDRKTHICCILLPSSYGAQGVGDSGVWAAAGR